METSTRPKYPVVKETFELIRSRVVSILADTGVKTNQHRLRYFKEMEKLRDRVHNLLQSYPQYETEKEKHDPTIAVIPEELLTSLKRLAIPPKKYVRATLMKINQILMTIIDDHQYQKDKQKMKRVQELMKYRKQLCCLLSKYPMSPEPSISCLRFRPCSTKPARINRVQILQKVKRKGIKINSRRLEINFDKNTNELSLPTFNRIKVVQEFYTNVIDRLSRQLFTCQEPADRRKKLVEFVGNLCKRREMLDKIRSEIDTKRKLDSNEPETAKHQDVRGTFVDSKFKSFKPFTHFLELPSRWKLQQMFMVQKDLLFKECRKVQRENCQKLLTKCAANEAEELPKSRRRPFMERLLNNVCFITNILASYPIEEKPPHCIVLEKQHRFKPTQKKSVSVRSNKDENGNFRKTYDFDELTNDLAAPKIMLLQETARTCQDLLSKFLMNTKNLKALQQSEPKIIAREGEGEVRKIPSQKQQNKAREQEIAIRIKRDHKKLQEKTLRLMATINQQMAKITELQSKPGSRSDYFHHIVCHALQVVDKRKEYPMTKPHETVCSSLATRNRLQASLVQYRSLLAMIGAVNVMSQRKKQLRNEKSSNEVQQNMQSSIKKEIKHHTNRLHHNMVLLETMLSNYPEINDASHERSHKKLDEKPFEHKMGIHDENRVVQMAKPRKVLLLHTFETFRNRLSPEKQNELKGKLNYDEIVQPEKVERKFRKVRADEELLRVIQRKITSDVFEEIVEKLMKNGLRRKIVNRKKPAMMSNNMMRLQNTVYNEILEVFYQQKESNDITQDQETLEHIHNLAGAITDFIEMILSRSMFPKEKCKKKAVKPLKTAKKNRDLLRLAQRVMKRIAAKETE